MLIKWKLTFRGDGCVPLAVAVGVVETGVGVVESFAELLFDLFEYDMSGIAAGARTFTENIVRRRAMEQCVNTSTVFEGCPATMEEDGDGAT